MDKIILKEQLKDAIGNRKVLAALFHTFNFEPRFFENYVMPLLLPEKYFSDEIIFNKILWRQCAKDNIIPPITIYCDYYAKDNTEAPSLGYNIRCIKMPSAPGKICNFHSKQIYILLEDNKSRKSILCVTGSGNLTANGWCDNIECFSFQEYSKNRDFPKKSYNYIQGLINYASILSKNKLSDSEDKIISFLNYVDLNDSYFNNCLESFSDFLEYGIFIKDEIKEIEIISPYFSPDIELLEVLRSFTTSKINCLIPTLRNNEIQINKEIFKRIHMSEVNWCNWSDKNLSEEVRNQHAKIYRFYGKKYYFTIVGSVNFTKPAWGEFKFSKNKANYETAILYKGKLINKNRLLKPAIYDISKLRFIEKEDLENPNETDFINRFAPDIDFTIDWKENILIIYYSIGKLVCHFFEMLDEKKICKGKSEIKLNKEFLKQFKKNGLIKIKVKKGNNINVYTYYPNQMNIENKPLDFKLDANIILKYWQFFDNYFKMEKITKKISEQITDESGFIDEKKLNKKSLLNEMASYFNSLVNLERYLFPEISINRKEVKKKFQDLRYYLLSENIDTIPFFLNEIKGNYKDNSIQKSFYWMLLQVLINSIYQKAEKWDHRRKIESKDWKCFKKDVKSRKDELKSEAKGLVPVIEGLKEKEHWIIEQLKADYENNY